MRCRRTKIVAIRVFIRLPSMSYPMSVCASGMTVDKPVMLLQVLKQGSSPLAYLTEHVEKYVACVKDSTKEGCDVILKPPKKTESKAAGANTVRWPFIPKEIGLEHYV